MFKISGMGPLVEGRLAAERRLGGFLSVTGTLGYRIAKVYNLRIKDPDGVETAWTDTDGSRFTLDYSGPVVRLGLRFAASR